MVGMNTQYWAMQELDARLKLYRQSQFIICTLDFYSPTFCTSVHNANTKSFPCNFDDTGPALVYDADI